MIKQYDPCERIREAIARSEIRTYLTEHIPNCKNMKIYVKIQTLTFVLFDADRFYEIAKKIGCSTANHGKTIETVVNIETSKGNMPWKCILHSDMNAQFQEKYEAEMPIRKVTNKYNVPLMRR